MLFGGTSKKIQQEQAAAKADYEKALTLKGESKQEIAFRLKVGLRARSCVDRLFVDGAEKLAAYSEACLVAIAREKDKPDPPKSTCYPRIKTVNGEISGYLPQDYAKEIFSLGGKYQNVEIDAKTAIRRAQVICNQVSFDLDLAQKIIALQFLRDELEEEGDPYTEEDESADNDQENDDKQ